MISLPLVFSLLSAGADSGVDFDTQVMPVFTKAGCNIGACHGAAVGQGGFKLSLLGERPADDYATIVHELEGRRINLARPEESLLLAKPGGLIDHGGGYLLEDDSPEVGTLLAWISQGAARLQLRKLTDFRVEPARAVVEQLSQSVPLRVWASFDDGQQEDVTTVAVILPSDPAAAEVDAAGVVRLKRQGLTTLNIRYLDRVAAVQLLTPLSDTPVDLSHQPRQNFIDDQVLDTLATLRLPVAPPADDAAFLRRLYLDLTGTLPSPAKLREFLADRSDKKRARLIDDLLASDQFAAYWTLHWANWLRIDSRSMSEGGARAMHDWVRRQLAENTPVDAMVREMLTALGDSRQIGAANFARAVGGPRELAEHVSELFMGARLACANCHNHPLDRWTQDDYHGLAAIFAKLERGPVVRLAPRGEVTHPRTGEAAAARLPGERFLEGENDDRHPLAAWLTAPENPFFSRNLVNRLWKKMLGRGLVEPVDDLRATNPPTHPALLQQLADDFTTHGYDMRHTLRLIASSATYARGQLPGGSPDDRFYASATQRPLPAEVVADMLADVTGVAEQFGEAPAGTRAVNLLDACVPSQTLDILGRCSREESCEDTASTRGLATRLHLVNGPPINAKITSDKGRLHGLLADGTSDQEMLGEFYSRALCRFPREAEQAFWLDPFSKTDSPQARREVWEDLLWSLLSSREFLTNH